MSEDRNAAVVRRYIEDVVGAGKLEILEEIAAEDLVQLDHDGTPYSEKVGWPPGRAGLAAHVEGFRRSFPDLRTEVLRLISSGDQVCALWRATGTHRDVFVGVPATNRRASGLVASIFRLVDGKIVEYIWVFGKYRWLKELGVEEPGRHMIG